MELHPVSVYYFPVAAVTNYHRRGLKEQKFIFSQLQRSEIPNRSYHWAEMVSAGPYSFRRLSSRPPVAADILGPVTTWPFVCIQSPSASFVRTPGIGFRTQLDNQTISPCKDL